MRKIASIILLGLTLFGSASQAFAQQSLPADVNLQTTDVGARQDTVTVEVQATIYTDSLTAAMMSDTVYLKSLTGNYLIGGSGPEAIVITLTPERTLRVRIPHQGEYDMIPDYSGSFDVQGLVNSQILFFVDGKKQCQGLNIIYKDKSKPQLMAAKK